MTIDEVIAELDGINASRDCEYAHGYADDLLLEALNEAGHSAVVLAYDRLKDRAAWWACA